ncbi:MAG: tRNA (adenosine(37)-N6)-threonylcarbamoyltransferase complex dimerization subunit type 1 TsaB [SAR86 cluster bacterium]|jgi:tRNA threonylcarbamoyladenosine biosynthesis protein TsaB|nr:tRNA (adenosine(37)-N6)-threonylcarbamoyltransferase complex dimerization subunit type 1 TsaB [SAR86 cluster bacterium]
MPNILAIETSSDACSLALSKGKEIVSFHELMPQQHTEKLLGLLQQLMDDLKATYQDLDVIAAGCGPGSFTGTRLACSVAQGLAYSLGISTIPVSSLQVIAQGINREFHSSEVNVLVNAHMGQVYLGNFVFTEEELKSASEKVLKVEEFSDLDLSPTSVFVGDGCELITKQLEELGATIYTRYPNAQDLLSEAQKKFSEGATVDPKDLVPVYLSGEEHWVKL